jgi:hypothetical protein
MGIRTHLELKEDSYEYGYMLGVYMGDGYATVDRLALQTIDIGFIEKFKTCTQKCTGVRPGGIMTIPARYQGYPNGLTYHRKPIHRISFCSIELFKHIKGLDNFNVIKKFSKEQKRGFIEGFFDSEGHVKCGRVVEVSMTQKTPKILETIAKIMLDDFMIHSSIYTYHMHTLMITNKPNCQGFAKNFTSSIERKQKTLDNILQLDTYQRREVSCAECGHRSRTPADFRLDNGRRLCNQCFKTKYGFIRKNMERETLTCKTCNTTYSLSISKIKNNKGECTPCRIVRYRK